MGRSHEDRLTTSHHVLPDRAARRAVTAVFLANGLGLSTWVTRIPDVQADLGLREVTLGIVLAALAAGVITGLVAAGRVSPKTGSRAVAVFGAGVVAVALPLIALTTGPMVLATALFFLGLGTSTMDVGMNAQGVGVERAYGRSIMVGLHGAWSVGALLGALLGGLAIATGTAVGVHLSGVAVVIGGIGITAAPWLRVVDRAARGTPGRFALPRGALFPLALIAFAAALGESSAADWSGIHLRDVVAVAPERIAWGFIALTAAMTTVRLIGDTLVRRFGARFVIVAGGWIAGLGFLLIALVAALPAALLGFVMVGAGTGVTIPLAFAAAGRVADSPGEGVAAVASVGYLAYVVGPPAIGAIADLIALPVAFGLAGVVLLGLNAVALRGAGADDL